MEEEEQEEGGASEETAVEGDTTGIGIEGTKVLGMGTRMTGGTTRSGIGGCESWGMEAVFWRMGAELRENREGTISGEENGMFNRMLIEV